ncbi:MAG: type II toxin-antitoxin system VapB family antitoxin [Candidatus Baldrarchaeia archaeon]
MNVVSIRIPKKLKEEMKKVNVNWSKYLRSVIEEKIRQIKMEEASRKIDEIRNKTAMGVFNAAKSIREDRDKT